MRTFPDGKRGFALRGAGLWAAGLAAALLCAPAAALELPAPSAPAVSAAPTRVTRIERKWKRIRRKTARFIRRRVRPVSGLVQGNLGGQLAMWVPSRRHLPESLRERGHDDFAGPFRWIPRSWTSFRWGRPRLIVGKQANRVGRSPKPIGEPGSFQFSRFPDLPAPFCWLPLYFSCTTPGGLHFRVGARWDDVDFYTQVPSIAIKKIPN